MNKKRTEETQIFKYKDPSDGNYTFIIAKSEQIANEFIRQKTTLNLQLIGSINSHDLKQPFFLFGSNLDLLFKNQKSCTSS